MKLKLTLMTMTAAAAFMMSGATTAAAETTLETVQARGHLRCQVGPPSPGYYNLDAAGEWYGLDVSICRSVAAAIFGDATKLEIQSVSSQARFTALANGDSDMLSRTATMTMSRDTQLGLDFLPPNFYDGQGFTVRKDSGITNALQLKGAKVCVTSGTTTELNLTDFSRENDLGISNVTFDDYNVRDDTYLNGGCDAVTGDKSSMAGNIGSFPVPSDHMILPETLSKEPLAPAVRHGDSQWADIVRWSVYALINAEELGITQANVDDMRANSKNPNVLRMLGVEGNLHEGLGLGKDWAYDIIKSQGNYGEIYEKYMGHGEQGIGIDRAGSLNALWTDGGLMYSPPMR
ncbi:MAG: amino acid ABC transporter substrate-binding protein [Rhizobiales bacterium]|nr:amino acid ABC transporter substrate-binding protein [Hyphomicrobiales bacterium]NRB13144.1 amino acid ABC transporter substrate-binding protein [Hyphomicrobiales bacterium]